MATLVLSAIGTALGGPLGGAIGALLGQQADRQIFAPAAREGPRLQDLAFTASSYGVAIPRHYGRMRVGGTIIWAADLAETRHREGGGKGHPATTTYSYAASFAVALSSRPLDGIGRIWADGTLLRGRAGDLKVGGQVRFHPGHGDQPPDPLLAAAEGSERSPAYRGLAYVVFEDLQLADFGNRLPTLSFEVFGEAADSGLDLAQLGADAGSPVEGGVPLPALTGLSVAGSVADSLAMIEAVIPFACDCAGPRLRLFCGAAPVRVLGAATASAEAQTFGSRQGFARSRATAATAPPGLLRYYDIDRDYQAGVQRTGGQPAAGQPRVIELPAALSAAGASSLIDSAARRAGWTRQRLSWRTAELDPAVGPGTLVSVPGQPGVWQVGTWEWRAGGIELALEQVPGPALLSGDPAGADAGRAARADDRIGGPTVLAVFELPWDGAGTADDQRIYVAASSAAAGWNGATLYAEDGNGGLGPIGVTQRRRCVLGRALDPLPDGSSLLPDRGASVTIRLVADDLDLADASASQLAQGANRALLGGEVIQFARAVPLGQGCWRLSGLLRGRGGTEAATGGHGPDERFVLLDDRLTVLDGSRLAGAIAACGLGDAEPVRAAVTAAGLGRRPLFPVHPVATLGDGGALALAWTRRVRGGWAWPDQVELPLREEAELYLVTVGPDAAPLAQWQTGEPRLTIPAATVQALRQAAPGAPVQVRQRGSFGVSAALLLTRLV